MPEILLGIFLKGPDTAAAAKINALAFIIHKKLLLDFMPRHDGAHCAGSRSGSKCRRHESREQKKADEDKNDFSH